MTWRQLGTKRCLDITTELTAATMINPYPLTHSILKVDLLGEGTEKEDEEGGGGKNTIKVKVQLMVYSKTTKW